MEQVRKIQTLSPFSFFLTFLSILGDIGNGAFVRSRQLINNTVYSTKA